MTRTAGQERALQELEALAAVGDALRIDQIDDLDRMVVVTISVSTEGWRRYPGGISFGDREELLIRILPDYPIDVPSVVTTDLRWADRPHVNWGRSLCVFAEPGSQWEPSEGMHGFISQLDRWLRDAAEGRLDPDDVPAHPLSATYSRIAPNRIVVRKNTPLDGVRDARNMATFAHLRALPGEHYEIVGWERKAPTEGELIGAAFLANAPIEHEYPTRLADLLTAIDRLGIDAWIACRSLRDVAHLVAPGMPLFVIVGTANRGTSHDPWSHLVAFRIEPSDAEDLRNLAADDKARERFLELATAQPLAYVPIIEARPAVTQRRDQGTAAAAFKDRRVLLLGAGALGGWIGEFLTRSGVQALRIVDNGDVSPGLLVRQPYRESDVPLSKAEQLAARLREVASTAEIEGWRGNAVHAVADEDAFQGVDLIIDATVSRPVAAALERSLLRRPPVAAAAVATDAEVSRGLLLYSSHSEPGSPYGLDRRTFRALAMSPQRAHFRDAFWSETPSEHLLQPEPGCSAPTFRGAASDVAAMAGVLVNELGLCLTSGTAAAARLFAMPGATPAGADTIARFDWEANERIPTDASTVVVLNANVASALRREASEAAPNEATGLLFGFRDYASNAVYVLEAAPAPPDSKTSRTSAERGLSGVRQVTERVRQNTGAEYLGDWHSHPGGPPRPSATDRRAIGNLERDGASLMLIVGGSQPNFELAATVLSPVHLIGEKAPSEPKHPPLVPGLSATPKRRRTARPARSRPCTADQPPRANLDPLPPGRRPIAVALSGGGFRATLIALGTLRLLSDAGLLGQTRIVSSVSGGSIANALIACRWAELRDSGFEPHVFDSVVAEPFVRAVTTRSFTAALVRKSWRAVMPNESRTSVLARLLDSWFLGGTLLEELPAGTWFEFNSANLETGARYRFNRDMAGDYVIGSGTTHGTSLRVAKAVAASAAVPMYFPPVRVPEIEHPCGTAALGATLVDGGVYDNLALEPVRNRPEIPDPLVVAANAGAVLQQGRISRLPGVGVLWRSQALLYDQTTALRSRALVREFASSSGVDGTHFRIGTTFREDDLPTGGSERLVAWNEAAPEQDAATRLALERFPTTFGKVPADTAQALLYRGWWLCGATLSVYHPGILAGALRWRDITSER